MHDEGYIKDTEWHYYLKDHLGNTRVDFVANGTSTSNVQDYHYYPFGMDFTGLNVGNSDNKYKYNGKELQGDHGLDWYDYGARFYDVTIGRWHCVDPMEQFVSPYNYAVNNIDPNGMYSYNWNDNTYRDDNGNEVSWAEVRNNNFVESNNGGVDPPMQIHEKIEYQLGAENKTGGGIHYLKQTLTHTIDGESKEQTTTVVIEYLKLGSVITELIIVNDGGELQKIKDQGEVAKHM